MGDQVLFFAEPLGDDNCEGSNPNILPFSEKRKALGKSRRLWQRMKDSNGETPFDANHNVPTRSRLRRNRSGMTIVRVRIPTFFLSQKKEKPSAFAEGFGSG